MATIYDTLRQADQLYPGCSRGGAKSLSEIPVADASSQTPERSEWGYALAASIGMLAYVIRIGFKRAMTLTSINEVAERSQSLFNKAQNKKTSDCAITQSLVTCHPSLVTRHSSSVLTSPSCMPSERAFSTRRMILPERVLGSLSTKFTASGLAIGPRCVPTWLRNSSASSGEEL